MTIRVAINGFGRIGRNVLRAWFEQDAALREKIQIVALNDLGSIEALAHLLKFDSTHGVFSENVSCDPEKNTLTVAGHSIAVSHHASPENCSWKTLGIDLVIESTGQFRARADAALHLKAGARRVVIAAVAFDEVDATIVMGVNEQQLTGNEQVISAASCTTQCIAPVLSLLDKKFQVRSAFMTEMHAYTSDQSVLDHVHRDLRRGRSAAQNMIPTSSSSIAAVQQVLPQLRDKITGYSMRVPIDNVAAVDLCVCLENMPDADALNRCFKSFDNKTLIAYSDLPLVSSDFKHRIESAIVDTSQTHVLGDGAKMLIWYDNEWAYVNRLLDLMAYLEAKK